MIQVASLISQLLRKVSRLEFHHLVAKHKAERRAERFPLFTFKKGVKLQLPTKFLLFTLRFEHLVGVLLGSDKGTPGVQIY